MFGQLSQIASFILEFYLFEGNTPIIDESFIQYVFSLILDKSKKKKYLLKKFFFKIFFF